MNTHALGRIPPHSTEAEQGVLGSILIDIDGLYAIGDILHAEDFYDPGYATIFQTMLELSGSGRPIDALTLQQSLFDRGSLESIG
jgi:replicative DNA helicase